MKRKYNDNITLVEQVKKSRELAKNEYYVLMVEDRPSTPNEPRSFFDKELGWLGLERTSSERIYISKNFMNRRNSTRGDSFIAEVKNPSLCYELDY